MPDVYSYSDDDSLLGSANPVTLGEDAGKFAFTYQKIVRPFQIGLETGSGGNALPNRNTSGKRKQRQRQVGRSGNEGEVESCVWRRYPGRSAAPATRCLLIGTNHGAVDSTIG